MKNCLASLPQNIQQITLNLGLVLLLFNCVLSVESNQGSSRRSVLFCSCGPMSQNLLWRKARLVRSNDAFPIQINVESVGVLCSANRRDCEQTSSSTFFSFRQSLIWKDCIELNRCYLLFFIPNGKCVTETGCLAHNSNLILNIEGPLGYFQQVVLSYTGLMPVSFLYNSVKALWSLFLSWPCKGVNIQSEHYSKPLRFSRSTLMIVSFSL